MTHECTEELVLKDLSRHEMQVIRDDGVHRHIRFKRPDSGSYWFDLITWPGTLCIDGDCGTYVFRRLDDMFEFFRTDREYALRKGNKLAINPGYWGEKLRATSIYGKGHKGFSEKRFRNNVKQAFDNWIESEAPEDGEAEPDEIAEFEALKKALWDEIEDQVLCHDNSEHKAMTAARDFSSDVVPDFDFTDFWEYRNDDYTFHFIWCCYAIAWGIQLYDESKTTQHKEAA